MVEVEEKRFKKHQMVLFDAGRFGAAVCIIRDVTPEAYEVDILQSTHEEFEVGGRGYIALENSNIKPVPGYDWAAAAS